MSLFGDTFNFGISSFGCNEHRNYKCILKKLSTQFLFFKKVDEEHLAYAK